MEQQAQGDATMVVTKQRIVLGIVLALGIFSGIAADAATWTARGPAGSTPTAVSTNQAGIYVGTAAGELAFGAPGQPLQIISMPGNGVITAVAAHPTDPDIVLVGFQNGDIWRTEDRGVTWQSPPALQAPPSAVDNIAFGSADPSFVYATLHKHPSAQNVLRSTDGGRSFVALPLVNPLYALHLAVDPRTSQRVSFTVDMLGPLPGDSTAESRMYLSDDAGETWRTMLGGSHEPDPHTPAYYVAFDPHDVNRIYALRDGDVWISDDAAGSFHKVAVNDVAYSIAAAVEDSRVVYVLSGPSTLPGEPGNGTSAVLRSTDRGATWATLPGSELSDLALVDLAIIPSAPTILYVAVSGQGMYSMEVPPPAPPPVATPDVPVRRGGGGSESLLALLPLLGLLFARRLMKR